MKKFLSSLIIILCLVSANAFAKTEGHYLGASIINTNFSSIDGYGKKHSENDIGIGFSYKYAINFDNFFIAPGLFFDNNNTKLKFADRDNDPYSDELKYSYGLKSDFGYDINDVFAVFATFGYSENRIFTSFDFTANGGTTFAANDTYESFVSGGGFNYSINKELDIVIAYEIFDYKKKAISNNMNIEVFRLGAAYNF